MDENYTNEEDIPVNDTCHEEWDQILGRMIFFWREFDEDICSQKNPYYAKAEKLYHKYNDNEKIM